MTLRSFFLALLVASLVLLSLAGGGVYWVLAQSPLTLKDGGVQETPSAAMFVPRQAPAMLSLLVNPDRLEALLQLGTPVGERKQSRRELDEIKAGLLSKTGLKYRKDVQSWLGEEITVAVTSLDYDRNGENGQQPGYLLVASAKDGEYAREFLQVFYAKSAIAGESDLVFEQYKGVNVIYRRLRETGESSLASAVVGDRYVLFANHPKVLRDALNNVQVPNLNLANAEAYQQALDTLTAPRIGVAYVNLLALAKNAEIDPNEPIPTLTLGFTLSPQGLVAESAISGLVQPVASKPSLNAPVGALNYLPPRTLLTASGVDLEGFWGQIQQGFGEDSPVAGLFEQALSNLQEPWGVDLPQDIFSWVQGEYALSLLPTSLTQPDWVFVAEKNTPEAKQAIDHLDELAESQNLSLGKVTVADYPVTVWTALEASGGRLSAQVKGVHGSVGNYEVVASSLEAITQVLSPNNTPLVKTNLFKEAIAPLPLPNYGYFYVDWAKSKPLLTQKVPVVKVLELVGQPLLDHLRSFTLTSQGRQNEVSRATIFFKLGLKN
ncbi:DUF3352 domain-containing protein [Spirulina subsalsa]|uniref:DUF3352 domain-containing protein n=1 Tax=Spirulina subsalsa TaxID=54311 RepID=UPI0002F13E5A|nr:DUF3352 domain-containing protein [Spirulina subsalsa]